MNRPSTRIHEQAPNRDCLEQFESLPREGGERMTSGFLVRTLLSRRYGQTGLEPERIPVTGEAGRKQGEAGMIRLAGGEFVRPGPYYTSQSAELGERTGDKYRVRRAPFLIDRSKVTNADYCRFLNDGNPGYWNSQPWSNITRTKEGRFTVEPKKTKWPVIEVNWYQAAGYARMFKGFRQGRRPEILRCLKRHARAPLLTAAIGFRCVKDAAEPSTSPSP